eukprot:5287548-Pleurochrysis_carterae.AAC.1
MKQGGSASMRRVACVVRREHSQSEKEVRVPRMSKESVNESKALGESRVLPSTRKSRKSEKAENLADVL